MLGFLERQGRFDVKGSRSSLKAIRKARVACCLFYMCKLKYAMEFCMNDFTHQELRGLAYTVVFEVGGFHRYDKRLDRC